MSRTPGEGRNETGLQALLEDYVFHLTFERRLADRTVGAYRSDLEAHLRTLTDWGIEDPVLITREHLREYLAHLHDQGHAPRSRLRARSSLRGFYRYLVREGRISEDPSHQLEGPRPVRELPKVLTTEEIDRLFESTGGSRPLDVRDRALLEIAYGTGARASELVGLGTEEVDLRERWVRIQGKGSKERLVPLGKPAAEAVRHYLRSARHLLLGGREDPGRVFLNARGGVLSRMGFWKILRKRAVAAGLRAAGIHPHVLRHSFATHLLQGGASLRVVQELLGHAHLKTTEIYTAVDRDYLRRVHQEFHPRG